MYIGKRKERIINSKNILSYFKKEKCRELYKIYVESEINKSLSEEEEG